MATSRLLIYNGALMLCGHRSLASLTVSEEARRLLDEVWNDGGVRFCLEQAQWKFAMRAVQLDYDTSVTPSFGYRYAFSKPTDWVSTSALCSDEYFNVPLLQYRDEAGYWYAELDQIYLRYVSDDSNFGGDLSKWPYSFTEFVKAYFAKRIVHKLPGAAEHIATVKDAYKENLQIAKNKDAMADPTKFAAQGGWTSARQGRRANWGPMGDGGSGGSLTG